MDKNKSKLSKRMQKAQALVKPESSYALTDALSIVKKYEEKAKTKFNETVDLVFRLGVDAKDTNNSVRGAVPMPNGLGKTIRIAVFAKPERVKEAKDAGADVYGSEELIEEVKNGKMNFDVCIATPDMMGAVSKIGRVLGPKGLMPNPKLGTVSDDIAGAVKLAKAGQVEFKIDKASIVHAPVGKLSFSAQELKENIVALYEALLNAKPANSKGVYMKSAYLTTTMGVSIKLDLGSLVS